MRPAFFSGKMRTERTIAFKMKNTPLENTIIEIITPIVEDMGFNLVCVSVGSVDGSQNVQIMAEDPATKRLGVDDCAKMSRAIAAILDVEEPIKGNYRLELSSPGIDRPLTTPQDFDDYQGFEAKLETEIPTQSGQKRFRGVLQGLNESNIILKTDTGDVEIPFAALSKAKLVLTDELIKRTVNT